MSCTVVEQSCQVTWTLLRISLMTKLSAQGPSDSLQQQKCHLDDVGQTLNTKALREKKSISLFLLSICTTSLKKPVKPVRLNLKCKLFCRSSARELSCLVAFICFQGGFNYVEVFYPEDFIKLLIPKCIIQHFIFSSVCRLGLQLSKRLIIYFIWISNEGLSLLI